MEQQRDVLVQGEDQQGEQNTLEQVEGRESKGGELVVDGWEPSDIASCIPVGRIHTIRPLWASWRSSSMSGKFNILYFINMCWVY